MKFQTPTIGGVRKIIRTTPATTVGTTIAEIGAGTITLAQLAAAISNLQAQQNNNGGGNIGPSGIFIETGPGLGGGGGGGVVNLRLTAPIPVFIGEDGVPGDDGPPGVAGAKGANGATGGAGPAGPAVFMLADDGDPGDLGPPGPPGPAGAQGVTGSQGAAGPALHILANDTEPDNDQWCLPPVPVNAGPFTVNGRLIVYTPPNQTSMFYAPNALGAATQGFGIQAINSSDSPYLGWYTADGTLRGDLGAVGKASNLVIGAAVGDFAFAGQGGGNLLLTANTTLGIGLKIANAGNVATFTSSVGVQGPTPAVTAGQTDIGTTTTTTIITTAGGIALPALAAAAWVVNVAGVKYGVPLFAL